MTVRRVLAVFAAILFAGGLHAGTVTLSPEAGSDAALRFDLADRIPSGARIDGATLTVTRLQRTVDRPVALTRMTRMTRSGIGQASAIQTLGTPGLYTWGSTPQMVADIQLWLDDPASNLGWILTGDPEITASAPVLAISFTAVEKASAAPTVSIWGLVFLAFIVAALGNRLRK